MTARTLFAMLVFAGIVVAMMWLGVLPALNTFKPNGPLISRAGSKK